MLVLLRERAVGQRTSLMKSPNPQDAKRDNYGSLLLADRFCRDAIIALGVFSCIFLLQGLLARSWLAYGVFDQLEVVFASDASWWRSIFANCCQPGDFNHPLLTYYFSIPIEILSTVVTSLQLAGNEQLFRQHVALYVAPVCSAFKSVLVYLTLRLLGLRIVAALLCTGMAALSFSSIVFGSVPDSYAVTGMALALISFGGVAAAKLKSGAKYAVVGSLGVCATGVTASNIIHAGWIAWGLLWSAGRAGKSAALLKAILFGAVVFLVTLTIYNMLAYRRVEQHHFSFYPPNDFVERFTRDASGTVENLARMPEMWARTFLPTLPKRIAIKTAIKNNWKIDFELSYNTISLGLTSLLLAGVAVVAFVGGTVMAYLRGGAWRWLGLASAASILTSSALYSWVGKNTFLYSQQWQLPWVYLIGVWFSGSAFRTWRAYIPALLALLGMAAANIYVLLQLDGWLRQI